MSADFDRLLSEATAHVHADRLDEAETAFKAALRLRPRHLGVLHNLGVLADRRGNQTEAIHYFAAATAIEPGHYDAHRALAFSLLAEGRRGPALDHFARTYELRRGDDRGDLATNSLDRANRTKLIHDAEQFRYLAARKRDGLRFENLARAYDTVARNRPAQTLPLTAAERDLLGDSYNTAIEIADAPEIVTGAIFARKDRKEILDQFQKTGAAQFDDLLTPEAFNAFRRYLLESAIWHDFSHIDGFVATYLEDGLACPLLMQIVDEVRQTFPEVLARAPLSQAWAFKGVTPNAAVDAHVDDGAVSLNFWMTPTEANLEPGRGGMRVCRVPPPADWAIEGYAADRNRALRFLEQHAHDTLTTPYRTNRAVMFKSRLVHASDAPNFVDAYEAHRINVTLLFGRGVAKGI